MLPQKGKLPGKDFVIDYIISQVMGDRGEIQISDKSMIKEILNQYLNGGINFEQCCDLFHESIRSTRPIDLLRTILTILPPNISEIIPNNADDLATRKKTQIWKYSEDMRLLKGIMFHGNENWTQISENFVMTKSSSQCNQRWLRKLNPQISKAPWAESEVTNLIKLVEERGEKAWADISREIGNRSDSQCRFKYQ